MRGTPGAPVSEVTKPMFKTTGTMDNGIECPPHVYSRSSEPPMSDPAGDRLYCYRCGYY